MEIEDNNRGDKIKKDLKLNITSTLLTLSGACLFLIAIKKAKTIGTDVDSIVGFGDFMFLLGFGSAILAKIRKEPRRLLTGFLGSSAESVEILRFRQFAKCMI